MNVSPYKRFEKAFKRAYLKPLILLRYGTLRPERAKLHGSEHWIYIDAADPCARKKVIEEPLRGKVSDNLIFWRDFNRHLTPDAPSQVQQWAGIAWSWYAPVWLLSRGSTPAVGCAHQRQEQAVQRL